MLTTKTRVSSIFAAAVLALGAGSASAATLSEDSYFDGSTFVYEFGARQITAADAAGSFSFLLNSSDFGFSSLLGNYLVSGDISGTRFEISQVKINGTPWTLGVSGSNIDLGSLDFPSISSVEIIVSGARLGAGANFQGSLVLTPVPEPETYALLLGGLGVLGFVARRRKSV